MTLDTLKALLEYKLQELYYSCRRGAEILQVFHGDLTSTEIQQFFETHLETTQRQIKSLESAFDVMNLKSTDRICPGIDGLISETMTAFQAAGIPPVKDAVIASGELKIEFYKMASFQSAADIARLANFAPVADILHQCAEEETKAAHQFMRIINPELAEDALGLSREENTLQS